MSLRETACSYALLILEDDKIPVTADKISTLLKTAKVEVESYWPNLFAKLAEKKNISHLITSAGGGGAPVAVVAAPVAAAGGAATTAPAADEKKVTHYAGGGGVPVAVVAAPVVVASGAAAAAPTAEEKKEEPKEESDDDMGFNLFD